MWKSTKRGRDVGRKYENGSTKRKLTAKRKAASEKLKSALNRYLKISNADKEPDEKNEKDEKENKNKYEKESNDKDAEENNAKDDKQESQLESLELNITVEKIQLNTTESKEIGYNKELNITDDPATWPEIVSQQIRDYLV